MQAIENYGGEVPVPRAGNGLLEDNSVRLAKFRVADEGSTAPLDFLSAVRECAAYVGLYPLSEEQAILFTVAGADLTFYAGSKERVESYRFHHDGETYQPALFHAWAAKTRRIRFLPGMEVYFGDWSRSDESHVTSQPPDELIAQYELVTQLVQNERERLAHTPDFFHRLLDAVTTLRGRAET